ncbi:MAG: methionine--tRNA ligase [Clostridia bacterium]|nr:methionine--tRNA ligase [Clostridia bacterium]
MRNIFIGGAWPYANGSLHLGQIAALLPGDILARYFRLKGDDVLFVSGSDCHGTPISIRAVQEGVLPGEITERYHKEFEYCFDKLGFTYDKYGRTDQPFHHQVVKDIFSALLEKGFIYKRIIEQFYCEKCRQFLPDRYVEGTCPRCSKPAKGDQCDFCSTILEPGDLLDKRCKLCGGEPVTKPTEHFFLALSEFQKRLESYVDNASGWRENAIGLSKRYLSEGLQDRAATRDLPWGIDVPLEGYEGKKIYVWIEAVSGYLSVSKQWAREKNMDWERFWNENTVAYYTHGKDNIPFHTLILPALLLGVGGLHLPDKIISSEYLTIEGKKLSTSRNWAIWVPYIIEKYNADSLRYYLTINGPEKRDADFSWREFVNRNNAELLGAFGNLVNRTLVFIHKSFGGKLPAAKSDPLITDQLDRLYLEVGKKIEDGEFKHALEQIFTFIRSANKYFDERQPWVQVKENITHCEETLYNCVQIIANLSNLLSPFIPFACDKIRVFLGIGKAWWEYVEIPAQQEIRQPEILFERIDKKNIEEESAKLGMKGT